MRFASARPPGVGLARLALAGLAGCVLAAAPLRGSDEGSSRSQFAAPARGEILAPGAFVEVRWERSAPCDSEATAEREREDQRDGSPDADADADRGENEAELVLSLDGGTTFPIRVSGEISPCASRSTWRVPALPTSQARLGLRTGENERDEDERIELVSGVFTILPDPDRRPETLYARGGEWWIPEAPSPRGAEDNLRQTLRGAGSQIVQLVAWIEIAVPASPAVARPSARLRRLLPAPRPTTEQSLLSLASAPSAPTPLRC